jgi:2-polyprenyl-3-methyl-5-hydroxy-6-metoxy-1,4-benzoquinol methylase
MSLVDQDAFPNLAKLVREVLARWPDHERYLGKSLSERDAILMRHSEALSTLIIKLAGTLPAGLASLAEDYRFLCEKIVLPEEFHFRRTGSYRLKSFKEALRTVYNDTVFMTRYMNGLLLSDVLWINHCRGLQHYVHRYLPSLKQGSELLEIGPGHGLLLFLASEAENIGFISAWDVSEASLALSQHGLATLGSKRPVKFEAKNIFEPSIMEARNGALFDGVILSEVLEHLEHPKEAIQVLFHLCKPGGRVWINVPANSPAPDHLYLVSDPKEVDDLIRSVGFNVVDTAHLPMTGVSLDRALKHKLTISCIVVGERPPK